VQLLVDGARINAYSGVSDDAVALADRSLALADKLGEARLMARALFGLSIARVWAASKPAVVRPILDRGLELGVRASDWRTLSRLYLNRATICWLSGDLEGAVADRRHAIAAAIRSGETERLVFAHVTLGWGLMLMGAWHDAREAIRAGLAADPLRVFADSAGGATRMAGGAA
jgi:hypothetical protein